MTASEPFLKTQQAARALGVSVATVKRWVDDGKIRAARTSGKHRLIPISEVKRMAREIGKDLPGVEGLVDLIPGAFRADDSRVIDVLTDLLRDGRGPEARALIRAVARSEGNAAELADHLIRPVMERIGHGWMVGSLDIYQEHQATSIVAAGIQERIDELSLDRVSPSPLALGATTEGDYYILSGLLGELLLREQGWAVRNLGTNLPLRSLANATREYRPQMVFLTINHLKDEERFIREYLAFHEAAVEMEAAVIIGGRALRPDLRSQLPYSAFGDRMATLAEFARRLAPRALNGPESPTAPRLHSPADGEHSRSNERHE